MSKTYQQAPGDPYEPTHRRRPRHQKWKQHSASPTPSRNTTLPPGKPAAQTAAVRRAQPSEQSNSTSGSLSTTSALLLPAEEHDRPFNGFRVAKSAKARVLVLNVLHQVLGFEHRAAVRKRARKASDQKVFERQIEALVCDLAHRHITCPGGWLAIPFSKQILGKKDRYRAPVLNKTLPDVVDRMASQELRLIELELGHQNPFYPSQSKQTVIRAGQWLSMTIIQQGLTAQDFRVEHGAETIILKAPKQDHLDKGKLLQYHDDHQTIAFREDVGRINRWLEEADLSFESVPGMERAVDPSDRRLRRIFNNGSFQEGGRLFGGFWQELSKRQRREGIDIDGSPTVTLDYGQMCPRILYGLAGVEPHFDDAYAVPGLERYRDGVKLVFNAMLHADKPLARAPEHSRVKLPPGMPIAEVTDKIRAFHAPIADAFYAGRGMHVFFHESSILIALLLRLNEGGITALPIHDAVIVAEQDEEETERIMLEVFNEHTGIDGQVSIDY
jgi:hypothetical protein